MVYFVPIDRQPTPDYEKKIGVLMYFVTETYRQDYEARGIPSAGLQFQMRDGRPIVHPVQGRRPAAYYNGAPTYSDGQQHRQRVFDEIPPLIGDMGKHVVIVFVETYDPGPAPFEWPGGFAVGARVSTTGGFGMMSAWILRPEFCATNVEEQRKLLFDETPIVGRTALGHGGPDSPRFEFIEDGFGAVAHELGHALGLQHDSRQDRVDIMGNGFRHLRWNFTPEPDPNRRARFSDENALVLYASRYLAPDILLADLQPPKVQLQWAAPLRQGTEQIRVNAAIVDNAGLRGIVFFAKAQDSVVGGVPLAGQQQVLQQTLNVKPLAAGEFVLLGMATDVGGNLTSVELKGLVSP